MERLIFLLIFSILTTSCGTKQQNNSKSAAGKTDCAQTETSQIDTAKANLKHEETMWKIASYAGSLGDNKNSFYITNTYAIWGTYKRSTSDNTEIKVKFLIDKVSFCIKLYEYGTKVVKKGDENFYKITITAVGNEPLQITAKNVSDRIFINEPDAKAIMQLLNKGVETRFSMVTDSKLSPSSYTFVLDHPVGISDILKKLSN